MAVDKNWCLAQAIDIAKEYARGGGQLNPHNVLEYTYEMLKKLSADVDQ